MHLLEAKVLAVLVCQHLLQRLTDSEFHESSSPHLPIVTTVSQFSLMSWSYAEFVQAQGSPK